MGNTNQQIYGMSIRKPGGQWYTTPGVGALTPERGTTIIAALFHLNGGFASSPIAPFYAQYEENGGLANGFCLFAELDNTGLGARGIQVGAVFGDGTAGAQTLRAEEGPGATGPMGRWGVMHLAIDNAETTPNLLLFLNGQLVARQANATLGLPAAEATVLQATVPSAGGLVICERSVASVGAVGWAYTPDALTLNDLVGVINESAGATISQRTLLMRSNQNSSLDLGTPDIDYQGRWLLRSTNPEVPETLDNVGSDPAVGPAKLTPGDEFTVRPQRDVYDNAFLSGAFRQTISQTTKVTDPTEF